MFTPCSDLTQYTFENFRINRGNRLAHAAALAVAENPGADYSPLVMYEECLPEGKASEAKHLMFAIANRVERVFPEKILVYIPGRIFRQNEVLTLLDCETCSKRYDAVDVLLIDDIQEIQYDIYTQKKVQYIIDSFYEKEKQVIITSSEHPCEIPDLDPILESQIMYGLVVNIKHDGETDNEWKEDLA